MTSLRTPFSAKDTHFVRHGVGAGRHFVLSPTCDTVLLKQDKSQQEMSQCNGRIITLSGQLGCLLFPLHNWFSFFLSKSCFIFLFSAGRQNQYCMYKGNLLQNRQILCKSCITTYYLNSALQICFGRLFFKIILLLNLHDATIFLT